MRAVLARKPRKPGKRCVSEWWSVMALQKGETVWRQAHRCGTLGGAKAWLRRNGPALEADGYELKIDRTTVVWEEVGRWEGKGK